MPPGWQSHQDPNSGRTYYVNNNTSETSWTKPAAMNPVVAPLPPMPAGPPPWGRGQRAPALPQFTTANPVAAAVASTTPVADQELPEPWIHKLDKQSGRMYYANPQTRETLWQRPVGARSMTAMKAASAYGGGSQLRRAKSNPHPDSWAEAQAIFERYDRDRDGSISPAEAIDFIRTEFQDHAGRPLIDDSYVTGVWGVYDVNKDNVLSLDEFARFYEVVKRKARESTQQPQQRGRHVSQSNSNTSNRGGGGDWQEHRDPNSGRTYYANRRTKETSWTRPAELA